MALVRRLLRLQFAPAAAAALAAAALAGLLLRLDGVVEAGPGIPVANARALLGASVGALVTIGAFTFWMRPLAAQMATSNLPPPILASRMHDGFQRLTVSATVAALTYHCVVLYALPVEGPSPPIATIVAAFVTVASVMGLLIGMQRAEWSTRPGRILAAARAVVADDLEALTATPGAESIDPPELPSTAGHPVCARTSGWVHDVDVLRMAAAVPSGSTVRVEVGLGSYVTERWTTLAIVWAPRGDTDLRTADIGAAVAVSEERRSVGDLQGSLVELVDVAVHAALGGSASPSIVFEAVWHLGAALHGIIDRDLPGPHRRFDGDRSVVLSGQPDHAAVIEPAVQRVRRTAAADPTTAVELIRVLREVRDHAAAAGRGATVAVLDRELDLVVAQCRHSDVLGEDLDQVRTARAVGAGSASTVAPPVVDERTGAAGEAPTAADR